MIRSRHARKSSRVGNGSSNGGAVRARRQAPLGPAFARLLVSATVSNIGDGFTLTAGPLLLTRLTDDPILIGGAAGIGRLPMLAFGLAGGALVDRFDRRRLLIGVDVVRAGLMTLLAVSVVAGWPSVWLTYLVLFLLGLGDTVVMPAEQALLPAVVDADGLTRANARLVTTRILGANFIGPPLGALLFTHAPGTPFVVDAVSFVLGITPLFGLRTRDHEAPVRDRPRIVDGLRGLWQEHTLRLLALCIFLMNVTFSGTMATLVLYSHRQLGLGDKGYGVLVASSAVGGLVGGLVVSPLVRRFGAPLLLWVGLALEASTHLGLALTSTPVVAGLVLMAFGVHATIWSVVTLTLRQERVDPALLGRVSAAYLVFSLGGSAIGAFCGGLLVRLGGVTAPLWVGFGVVSALVLAVGPRLGRDPVP